MFLSRQTPSLMCLIQVLDSIYIFIKCLVILCVCVSLIPKLFIIPPCCRTWLENSPGKNAVDVTCVNNARHKKWKDDVKNKFTFISAQFSRSVMSDSLWPHEAQHARPPCPSPTPGVYPNSCPLSRWCHLTISSSVIPFSSCLQSFPTSGSFQMSQLFTLGGENIGVSASTSVLPMNTQDWSPLG